MRVTRLLAAAALLAAPLATPAFADPENGCTAIAPGSFYCTYYTETGNVQFTFAGAGGYSLSAYKWGSNVGWTETNSYDAYVVKVATMHLRPGDEIVVTAYAGPAGTYSIVDVRDVD